MTSPAPLPFSHTVGVADLETDKPQAFHLRPAQSDLGRIAAYLGAISVSKLRLRATLTHRRDGSVELDGRLGATVTQSCVVSFAPVRTHIDEKISRRYLPGLSDPEDDHQMGEDEDEVEPLGTSIDLGAVLLEDLALAMPAFPRAPEARLESHLVTIPGVTPMTDEAARPFAALAALRDKMKDPD